MKKKLIHTCIGSLLLMGYGAMSVAAELSSITVTPINSTINAGQTKQYAATGSFRNGSSLDISSAGSFSATGSMDTPRETPSASTLISGKVLVTGGVSNMMTTALGKPGCDVCNRAEVYDPATETFAYTTSDMVAARYMHTSTRLVDGQVLLTGGYIDASHGINSAELYDPATNTFSATSGVMSVPRGYHTATRLGDAANSKVLIVGGMNTTNASGVVVTATAELYDPASRTFTATGSMSIPREAPTATLLADGTVLIAGGRTQASPGDNMTTASNTAEIYDPSTGSFTAISGVMVIGVGFATATRLGDSANSKVLIAGGADTNAVNTNKAQLYDPVTRKFTETLGPMTTARSVHIASILKNGKVLVAGGQGGQPYRINAPELYDPVTDKFSATGLMSTGRNWHRAVLLNNGQVFVVGGFVTNPVTGGGMETATAEHYTPQADWTSSNANVAAISSTGLASSGKSPGTISITATSGSISGSTSLLNYGTDLTVTAVSSNVTSIQRGLTFTFTVTTKNVGNQATPIETKTGLLLNNGTVNTLLGYAIIPAGLAPGSSTTLSSVVTVPATQATGVYKLLAMANYTGALVELDETAASNNFTGGNIKITK